MSISRTLSEVVVNTMTSEVLVLSQGFHQGNLFIDAVDMALSFMCVRA